MQGRGEASERRLRVFHDALVANFDEALGAGAGAAWWAEHVEPVAAALRAGASP